MKLNKCPKCNSENIKTSALCVPDEGYVGYCTCQDCYFSVKSNNEFHRIPEMWSSRYEAIKVAKLLWNDIAENWGNISSEQAGYIGSRGIDGNNNNRKDGK